MANRTRKPLDTKKFIKLNNKVLRFLKNTLPDKMLTEFKKNTPKGSVLQSKAPGNAKRNTKLKKYRNKFTITGDYPYSGVIDRGEYPNPPKKGTGRTRGGYSTQSPDGMIEPTLEYGNKIFANFIRRHNR